MILKHLSILNYKNLSEVDITLSPKINCFLGDNGMGKTNLLDTVYYLSFCKSHSNPIDSQVIKHDTDICMIKGIYEFASGNTEEISSALKRRQKKQFKRNKKQYDKLSSHIGFIPLVMISPADNELIMGGSEERRNFMDVAISQFDKPYLQSLVRYNNALQQRNALLKHDNIDISLLEIWEKIMIDEGMDIFEKRNLFIQELTPIFHKFYTTISQSKETISLNYSSQLTDSTFKEQLIIARKRDMIVGHTSVGIHRDELEMSIDEYPIKKDGSQGQKKTYFVSLKLAQFQFLQKKSNTTPLLVLDDIFDRLDEARVKEIIKLVSSDDFGQIFISDTNRQSLDRILQPFNNNYHLYSVVDGKIERNDNLNTN
ncbi:MAG: DNA replication and repair protein RecF [Dysgonamonadaceae bacterium]|nr:DNA replication and repair protein RecF [Dysgonamonadaceae bacterium]